jgi:carbamate kinase
MVVVDQHDPAFATQMKFFGPAYTRQAAEKLSADKDWIFT